MILGGPTAGAWVAILATTDRRELQSQPWYGVLANHASIAIAAIAGGVAYALVARAASIAATGDPGLADVRRRPRRRRRPRGRRERPGDGHDQDPRQA